VFRCEWLQLTAVVDTLCASDGHLLLPRNALYCNHVPTALDFLLVCTPAGAWEALVVNELSGIDLFLSACLHHT
jgi:hypothetical protein